MSIRFRTVVSPHRFPGLCSLFTVVVSLNVELKGEQCTCLLRRVIQGKTHSSLLQGACLQIGCIVSTTVCVSKRFPQQAPLVVLAQVFVVAEITFAKSNGYRLHMKAELFRTKCKNNINLHPCVMRDSGVFMCKFQPCVLLLWCRNLTRIFTALEGEKASHFVRYKEQIFSHCRVAIKPSSEIITKSLFTGQQWSVSATCMTRNYPVVSQWGP